VVPLTALVARLRADLAGWSEIDVADLLFAHRRDAAAGLVVLLGLSLIVVCGGSPAGASPTRTSCCRQSSAGLLVPGSAHSGTRRSCWRWPRSLFRRRAGRSTDDRGMNHRLYPGRRIAF
jgi:hypothetical protein